MTFIRSLRQRITRRVTDVTNTIPKPKTVTVGLDLGGIKVEGTWNPSIAEKYASWDLYIELVTRISVMELPADEGILREGLSSLHAIFNKTREILHEYGPDVVHTTGRDNMSFGYLAIVILNYILRPFLTKWHPKLRDWEERKDKSTSSVEHETIWPHNETLRRELETIRMLLIEYASLLAQVADVPALILSPNVPTSDTIPPTTLVNEQLPFFPSTDMGAKVD